MSLRETIQRDIERLELELSAARAALRGYDGPREGRAAPKAGRKDVPSKRSIIAGLVTGRKRPELNDVMAALLEHGYPNGPKDRQAASNTLSKLLKARKAK